MILVSLSLSLSLYIYIYIYKTEIVESSIILKQNTIKQGPGFWVVFLFGQIGAEQLLNPFNRIILLHRW